MPLHYDQLTSMKFEPARLTYARKDTILHALFRLIASERGLVVEDFGRVEWAE